MKERILLVVVGLVLGILVATTIICWPEQPIFQDWAERLFPPTPQWTAKYGDSDDSVLAFNILALDRNITIMDANSVKYNAKIRIKGGVIRKR